MSNTNNFIKVGVHYDSELFLNQSMSDALK